MAGSGHNDWSGESPEVIGSKRTISDMRAYEFPLTKCSMLLSSCADHSISPFHLDHFGHHSLNLMLSLSLREI